MKAFALAHWRKAVGAVLLIIAGYLVSGELDLKPLLQIVSPAQDAGVK